MSQKKPEQFAYDMYTHVDGRVCLLMEDGAWFVPLDAGGEGFDCEREHGPSPRDLERQVRTLREALAFYADPESYHAIGFWFDPPCGRFAEDFSNDHGDVFYDRAMPGATARAALQGTVPQHNHITREILPEGECPGCDEYHDSQRRKTSTTREGTT